MGTHTKEVPRVAVNNKQDGVHLSTLFRKALVAFNITLSEADGLVKHHSEEVVHGGLNSSSKAKSNTSSNLLGLFKAGISGIALSYCNFVTLMRILRVSKMEITITLTRGETVKTIQHDVILTPEEPKSKVW